MQQFQVRKSNSRVDDASHLKTLGHPLPLAEKGGNS
jgi:hypothetical protein